MESVSEFKIAIVSDLDKRSKELDEDGHPRWKSLLLTGRLTYDNNLKRAAVEIHSETATVIKSGYSLGMRGMELSELIVWEGSLYTICDKTGIVYHLRDGIAIPKVIMADGNGRQNSGFKGEWMTRKNGRLLIGSHGSEVVKEGKIIHCNMKWIKEIDSSGAVRHIDWGSNYDAMRRVLGCPFPGYVIHESAAWSEVHKEWIFLPRKVSKEAFGRGDDSAKCGNVLLRCNVDFSQIKCTTIGTLAPTRGFSSFKFIPGTDDTVIVAIKSEELSNSQKSFITVFTVDGDVILDDECLGDFKYEGIEFI